MFNRLSEVFRKVLSWKKRNIMSQESNRVNRPGAIGTSGEMPPRYFTIMESIVSNPDYITNFSTKELTSGLRARITPSSILNNENISMNYKTIYHLSPEAELEMKKQFIHPVDPKKVVTVKGEEVLEEKACWVPMIPGYISMGHPEIIKDDLNGYYIIRAKAYKFLKSVQNKVWGFTDEAYLLVQIMTDSGEIYPTTFEEASKNGYLECKFNGLWITNKSMDKYSPKGYTTEYNKFDFRRNYTCNYKELLSSGMFSPTHLITESKRYTFGVEIECSKSFLPNNIASTLNTSCVRDGSLNAGAGGPEYVTGILTGDMGFVHLHKLCNTLTGRGTVDKFCGIHVHIGGFHVTKEMALCIYLLGLLLQDEIFLTLPSSRRGNTYCRLLKPLNLNLKTNLVGVEYDLALEDAYKVLYKHIAGLSKGPGRDYNKNTSHPKGFKCGYDHSAARYEWLNLVPTLFTSKPGIQHTLEFRPHSGTTDYHKIKNWILFCMAFVYYCENYSYEIINSKYIEDTGEMKQVSMSRVLQVSYPRKYSKLQQYFSDRTALFTSKHSELHEISEYDQNNTTLQLTNIKELCV